MPRLDPHKSGRCPRCFFRPALCLCDQIPEVTTKTPFVILRHWSDADSSTNTARLARLAMPSLTLHDYGHRDLPPFDPSWLPPGRLWLVFPPDADHPAPAADSPPPDGVVLLDGSWRHARRMSRRHPVLEAMPRMQLAPRAPHRDRIRQPPFSGGMATLEAVAAAVAAVEGEATAAPLETLFDEFVRRVRSQRGY